MPQPMFGHDFPRDPKRFVSVGIHEHEIRTTRIAFAIIGAALALAVAFVLMGLMRGCF